MKYHFIGIGGIGMSALARILRGKGADVQGSDPVASYVTDDLEEIGIEIFSMHHEKNVQSASTVIYGSAIKPHHPEYQAATVQEIPLLHRSQLLAQLMIGHDSLLVTGTHGKTTTSALLAHVLMEAGLDPTFALGGIGLNSSTNGRLGAGRFFVAEADESDGTFLSYQGLGGIITNIEEDHLDYWKTRTALIEGFKAFAGKISKHLWWCRDDTVLTELKLPGKSYGFSPHADLQITRWSQKGWNLSFDLILRPDEKVTFGVRQSPGIEIVEDGGSIAEIQPPSSTTQSRELSRQPKRDFFIRSEYVNHPQIEIPLLGKHNVLNAAAVFGLCLELGLAEATIRAAFKNFKGVKRRMEHKGENRGVTILDDYAHHPTEIKTTLQGLRTAAGERRIIAVFQPHRYSRFKDCWDNFLEAFESADAVFVTEVYSAGETPIEGITSERFAQELKKRVPIINDLQSFLRPHDVVITLGAGDITYLGAEIAQWPIKPFQMVVIQGGKSAEHEVSLLSSKMMTGAMNPAFYQVDKWTISKEGDWTHDGNKVSLSDVVAHLQTCDLVFPILHGPFGEDGMIQGFLETLGIPYVGNDFRACAVTMDKAWTKHIASSHGVKIARFIEFTIQEWIKRPDAVREKIIQEFQFPCYIKAIHLGSTFGVHRVKTPSQIDEAINHIAKLDYRFLVEEEIKGREMEFGFIGDDEVAVSDAAEVVRSEEVHTYANKYLASGNPSIPKTPLPPEVLKQGRQIAETVYRAVGCSGLARIDFFLDSDGTWILNEVNPMPGFTPMSVYPAIWKAEGVTMTEVADRVVIASLHRYRSHQRHLRPPEKPPVEL